MPENNTTTTTTENTKPYRLADLIEEHETMRPIMRSQFVRSHEVCELISTFLRNAFADFEGCQFIVQQGPTGLVPTITAFFNHRDPQRNDLPMACTKDANDSSVQNATLRSLRNFQNRITNGDKYRLTKEGQEAFSGYFVSEIRSIYNKDGKVNFGKVVSDVADPQSNWTQVQTQYTTISMIDPAKLLETIYGPKDTDGQTLVYGVRVVRALPSFNVVGAPQQATEYMLAIEVVSEEETQKLAAQFGLAVQSGLNIVR